MFPISFSIPIFHNSIPLSKMDESRINTGLSDKRIFHVLQDALHLFCAFAFTCIIITDEYYKRLTGSITVL